MRRLIPIAALAMAGVAFAAPASADLAPGIYHYQSVLANGVTTDTLVRVQDCGAGCIDLLNLDANTHQGQARVVGDQYVLDQFVPHGATCADGRDVDILARYTFDLNGGGGIYTLNGPNPCASGPVGQTTFTLTPAT